MAISKVIYGGDVLIDLTADTVTADKLLSGVKAHGGDGELVTGTCTYDADTSDATATMAEILAGTTAYGRGSKIIGSMKNNGGVTGTISTKTGTYTVPQGYHDGSGKVGIASAEQQKIIPENIREGIEILGVTGTMSGLESVKAQSKPVTPTANGLIDVLPDEGYNYLSSVTVLPIPYALTDNSAGGKTATIG